MTDSIGSFVCFSLTPYALLLTPVKKEMDGRLDRGRAVQRSARRTAIPTSDRILAEIPGRPTAGWCGLYEDLPLQRKRFVTHIQYPPERRALRQLRPDGHFYVCEPSIGRGLISTKIFGGWGP